jgi:hypothetical protein
MHKRANLHDICQNANVRRGTIVYALECACRELLYPGNPQRGLREGRAIFMKALLDGKPGGSTREWLRSGNDVVPTPEPAPAPAPAEAAPASDPPPAEDKGPADTLPDGSPRVRLWSEVQAARQARTAPARRPGLIRRERPERAVIGHEALKRSF